MVKAPSNRKGRANAKQSSSQTGAARRTQPNRADAAKTPYGASPFSFAGFEGVGPASMFGGQFPQIPAFVLQPLQQWLLWYMRMTWEVAHAQAVFLKHHSDLVTRFASERRDFYSEMCSDDGGDEEGGGSNVDDWNQAYRDWMASAFSASPTGFSGPFPSPFSGAPSGQGGADATPAGDAQSVPAPWAAKASGS
jgi:hypothetical protein